MSRRKQKYRILFFAAVSLSLGCSLLAATRYSVTSGDWNSTGRWSASSGGPPGASIPVAGDIVYIERGYIITVSGTQTCDSVIIYGGAGPRDSELIVAGGKLSIDGGMFVSGATFTKNAKLTVLNSGSVIMNGNLFMLSDNNSGLVDVLSSGVLTIHGDLSLTSLKNNKKTELIVNVGTLNLDGDLKYLGALGDDDIKLRLQGASTFNFGGNFDRTAAGNYGELHSDAESIINFNGTSAQTMSMTDYGAPTLRWIYGEVRINNSAGVTLDANVTQVANNAVLDDIRVQSGTFYSGGYSILLSNSKVFEVADGATYFSTSTDATGGIPTFTGTAGVYNFGDNSSVVFAASGDQTVPGITAVNSDDYGNVTISGSGIKTLAHPLNDAYDGGSGNIDLAGDFTISAGTFDVSANNYSIELAGNWNNSSGFLARNGTVILNGYSGQILILSAFDLFYNVVVNNTSSGLEAYGDLKVSNALTMQQGNVNAGSDKLVLGTSTANVGTLNYTAGSILGQFERWINSTVTPIHFPVGTAANNNLVTIEFANLSSGSLIIEFISTDPGATGLPLTESGDIIANQFTEGYWSATAANSLVSTDYDIALTGNGFTSYVINADTRVIKRLDEVSSWILDGSHVTGAAPQAYREGLSGISTAQFCLGVLCPYPTSAINGNISVCEGAAGETYSVTNYPGYTYAWTIIGALNDPEPASGQGTSSIVVDWGVAGAGDVNVIASHASCGSAAPVNLPVSIGEGIISSTVSNSNTNVVVAGTKGAEVLQIQVKVGSACGAVTGFMLNTNGTPGSTDPANDLVNAAIYYTGTSSEYAAVDTFGTLGSAPNGDFTISGSQVLPSASTVYFWLAYNINGGAIESNIVDAQLISMEVAGTIYTGMTVSDPPGSRVIHVPVTRYSVANGNWNSTASWSAVSGGAPGSSIPITGDIVYIERTRDITITGSQACDTLFILGANGGSNSRLIVDGGMLTVDKRIFISGDGGAANYNRDAALILQNAGTAEVNGNVSLLSDEKSGRIDVLTSGVLTVNGDVLLTSTQNNVKSEVNVNLGTLNVKGDVIFLGAIGDDDIKLRLQGASTFNFGGNFDRTAAGNYGELHSDEASIVNFNGTSAQTMSMTDYGATTLRWIYGEVRINNMAGVTLDANVTQVANNAVLDDIRVQSGTLYSGGYSILLPAAKEFEVADGAVFYTTTTDATGGIPTFNGTAGSYNFKDNSTVIFASAADQVVPGISADDYGNVILTESGVKTFTTTGTIDIAGILSLEGTATSAGTTPTFGSNASLQYKGSVAQTTGIEFPATFSGSGGLIIDNINGVSLNADRSLTHLLTFVNGVLITGANTLTLDSDCLVNGAGSGKYVYGNLEKGIGIATSTKFFEIGDASVYAPVFLNFTGTINVAGTILAYTTPGDHPQLGSSAFSSIYTVNRYWTLTNNGVSGFSYYDATFTFSPGDADPGTNPNSFIVGNYNPVTWIYPSTGARSAASTQATGLTAFGDYQIGSLFATYRSAGSGNWDQTSSWEVFLGGSWIPAPAVPSSASNTINILTTHTISTTTSFSIDELSVDAGAILVLGSDMTVTDGGGVDFTVNGTLDCGGVNILSGPGSFVLNSGATILLGSPEGISTSGATGNIQTLFRSFDVAANYTYNGSAAQLTGDGLPAEVNNLSINNATGVSLSTSITINGVLTLSNGALITGATALGFQNSDTPIVRAAGTISTSTSTDLFFGTPGNTAGAAYVIPDGTFTSPPSINDLSINRINDLTLNDQMLSIGGTLLCNGPLNTAGNLTLLSDASATALIDGAGTGSVTGNVTMQRYLPLGYGYKYFSSPFQGATVSEFSDDMDLAYWFPTVYRYDESRTSSGWVSYINPAGVLEPMNGYSFNFGSVSAPNTVDLTGEVNDGALSLTLYNNNNSYTQGLNLVGNPYPSAIDWDAASGWTKTNIDNALYYFNASVADQYGGTYSSYVNGVSSDGVASNVIPSMQGFFVHVSDGAYPVTGTLAMNNSVRISDKTHYFAKSALAIDAISVPLIRLKAIFTDDSASADPFVLYLDDQATSGFDGNLDARKLLNTDFNVPNLYALLSGGEMLSIDAVPAFWEMSTVIPLGVKTNRQGNLSFRLEEIDSYFAQFNLFFFDSLTNFRQSLTEDFEYAVQLEAGEYHNRFFIVLEDIVSAIIEPDVTGELFSAYSSFGKIKARIFDLSGNMGVLSLYSIDGRAIFIKEIKAPGDYEFEAPPNQGIYIVNYISGRRGGSVKLFIGN